jgi:hypothetical protein
VLVLVSGALRPRRRAGLPGEGASMGVAVAGLLLAAAVAGCTGTRAAGGAGGISQPPVRRLASPMLLEALVTRPRPVLPPPGPGAYGVCPAGSAVLAGPEADPSLCYRRLGQPAAISYASVFLARSPSSPGRYELDVALRPGGRAALRAITTRAAGHLFAVLVAGRAWTIATLPAGPLTTGMFAIPVLTRKQANELLRLLGQPG